MIFRFLILAFLLLSCSQKETQQNPHEQAKPTAPTWSLGGERNCLIDFNMFHLQEEFCRLDITTASTEKLVQLQALIYSDAFLQNTTITSSDYFIRMQWQMNTVLQNSNNPSLQQPFIDAITRSCTNLDLRTCRNFAVLKQATNSFDVLLKYLNNDSNKEKLELVYLLAAYIKNATNDLSLLQTFARRRQDFTVQNSLQSALLIDLQMNEPRLSSTERDVIRRYLNEGRRNLKDIQNRQELSSALSQERLRLGDVLLERRLEKLNNERPALLRSLNLTTRFTVQQREIFAIMDLIYWRYILDRDEALVLGRLYSEEVLVEAIKLYFRLILALEIHSSDLAVKSVMANLQSQTSGLLQKFYEDVDVVRGRWQMFKTSCQTLTDWVQGSLQLEESKGAINKLNAGLDVSIKTYSELPHNFYLALHLVRVNFDSRTTFGDPNANPTTGLTVFADLISPKATAQSGLRYTNDTRLLNSYLVKNSLAFLLRSQLLQTLGEDQDVFLRYFVKNIRNRYLEDISQQINQVKTFLSASRRASEYRTFCAAYNGSGAIERHLRLLSLREGLLYPTFDAKTFQVMNDFTSIAGVGGSNPDSPLQPFNAKDFPDMYEHIITDVEIVLSFYDLILNSLTSVGLDSTYVREEREQLARHQTDTIATFKNWNRMGECMTKIFVEEKKMREFVIGEEKKYLSRIYRDLKFLRQHPSELDVVKSRYKDTLFLDELNRRQIQPLDRLSAVDYTYSRFDFTARVASYIKRYSAKFNYIVELPESVTDSEIYSYTTRSGTSLALNLFVTDTTTESEFIQSAFRLFWGFGSYMSWTNTDAEMIDMYTYYINSLAGQLRTGSVTIAEFLSSYRTFCNFIRFGELEREILEANYQPQTYLYIKFSNMFLDYNQSEIIITRIYGIFDAPYTYVMEDILGKDFYVKQNRNRPDAVTSTGTAQGLSSTEMGRKGPRARAEFFSSSMKNLDKKLLYYPILDEIVVNEYNAIKDKLRAQEKLKSDFQEAINNVDLAEYRVELSLDLSIEGPRLSPPIVRSYGAEVRNFHSRTEDCFRAEKDCLPQFLENELVSQP